MKLTRSPNRKSITVRGPSKYTLPFGMREINSKLSSHHPAEIGSPTTEPWFNSRTKNCSFFSSRVTFFPPEGVKIKTYLNVCECKGGDGDGDGSGDGDGDDGGGVWTSRIDASS